MRGLDLQPDGETEPVAPLGNPRAPGATWRPVRGHVTPRTPGMMLRWVNPENSWAHPTI